MKTFLKSRSIYGCIFFDGIFIFVANVLTEQTNRTEKKIVIHSMYHIPKKNWEFLSILHKGYDSPFGFFSSFGDSEQTYTYMNKPNSAILFCYIYFGTQIIDNNHLTHTDRHTFHKQWLKHRRHFDGWIVFVRFWFFWVWNFFSLSFGSVLVNWEWTKANYVCFNQRMERRRKKIFLEYFLQRRLLFHNHHHHHILIK